MGYDPGSLETPQILHLTKRLAGYHVSSSPERGDKASRAALVASLANVGALSVVQGHFTARFMDELASFPGTKHDDQVDAMSRAFACLVPVPKGAAFLEIARRDGTKIKVDKPEPIRCTFAVGSVEWAAEQAKNGGQSV